MYRIPGCQFVKIRDNLDPRPKFTVQPKLDIGQNQNLKIRQNQNIIINVNSKMNITQPRMKTNVCSKQTAARIELPAPYNQCKQYSSDLFRSV